VHLGLEFLEEASFLGSSEFINLVGIDLVLTKIGGLSLVVESSLVCKVGVVSTKATSGGVGLLDDSGLHIATVIVHVTVVVNSTVEVLLAFNEGNLLRSESGTFSDSSSFSINFLDNGVDKDFLDYWLLEDFSNNFSSFLDISRLSVLFVDERHVFLLNEGGVFLVDNGLMVLMDVLLVDDGLGVLMDDVLMVLVHDVFLVFNQDVLVMLMDDILMDFFHDCGESVGLSDSNLISSVNLLSFV